MYALESSEERAKIDGDVGDRHLSKVCSKVAVPEIRENGNDLVGMAKRGDERADRWTLS